MANPASHETAKEEERQHRLDWFSGLAYYGKTDAKKQRNLGKITLCPTACGTKKTPSLALYPIRAWIADDGVSIHYQDDVYPDGKSFRSDVSGMLETTLLPTKATKFYNRIYPFFEENKIDSQTACFLLCHEKIYINGKKVVKRLGRKLVIKKGDIVHV